MFDKNKVPIFIDFTKAIYKYVVIIKSRTKKLLNDAGIEDLYKECNTEEVNYIVGKNGKLYPAYNIDNISKDNESKDPSSR
ncbi:MAG: hypothetical protein PV345_04190 [Wolbachia sp.]|nr:hypothetical protein [Wolbachia sp.]